MKIVRVEHQGRPVWGIEDGGTVFAVEGDIYASPSKGAAIGPLSSLKLLTPVTPENKVLVLLDNWHTRDDRNGPGFLTKPPNGRINPGETIIYPEMAKQVWIETELGIVIGKTCKRVTPDEARERILGYTVSNDVTAAEWKTKTSEPVYTGKGYDTFCILGPCIDTTVDPTNTMLRGFINDEQFFEKNSSHMIWNAYQVVSWVSRVATLNPGDVISCGACAETLTRLMEPGQKVGVAIDGIGRFDNPVRAEEV